MVFLGQAGTKFALPKCATSVIHPVDILDISLPQSFHEHGGAGGLLRGKEQVDMVGHQHIGMYGAAAHKAVFPQPFEIKSIITVSMEAGLAVVPPLDDVQGNAWKDKSWSARHENYVQPGVWLCKAKRALCSLDPGRHVVYYSYINHYT